MFVTRLASLCLVAAAICLGFRVQAAVLFSDSFSYADGPLVSVSAGTWTHSSGSNAQLPVVSGAAELSGTRTEDVFALLSGQPYAANGSTNIFYAAFKVQFTALPGQGGDYFAHFKDSSQGFRARVWALTNGAAPGRLRFGLSSTNASAATVTNQTDFTTNGTFLVVTRLTASNSAATLWINPHSETDPGISTAPTSSSVAVSAYGLRESGSIGTLVVDDLVIGTSFYDVVPADGAPLIATELQPLTLSEGTNATWTFAAAGAEPLTFQWFRDGVAILDATNSSLTFQAVTTDQAGLYSAVVSNIFGSTNTQPALLTVNPTPQPPHIFSGPQSANVLAGTDVTFRVDATGTAPLQYQWRFYGTDLGTQTSAQLIVSAVSPSDFGPYEVLVKNIAGSVTSAPAQLTVTMQAGGGPTNFSLLTYNVKGNGATNWTTNAAQVRAIGRQLRYLHPDIITFQEIPNDYAYEMTNFVAAFLPGYWLVTNSATDGFIRSAIASRFPIVRSQSWLAHADLNPYGYTNSNFTRDLFEAAIAVPSFEQTLHVFTTHLKSGGTTSDLQKRAAEAAAISNFFVTTFPASFGTEPYLLTGDLNESDTNQLSIQTLVSRPTALQITTPLNPVTRSYFTYSSTSATRRYDYVMPGQLLAPNILGAQVFRTDVLTSPLPENLFTNDSQVASDHLPVLMHFGNPYNRPFRLTTCTLSNGIISLAWASGTNRIYSVEASSNLTTWSLIASNLPSVPAPTLTFVTNVAEPVRFFRVHRVP